MVNGIIPPPIQAPSVPEASKSPLFYVSQKILGLSSHVTRWLILIALLLFIIAILSFWFSRQSFSDKNVQLKLEGPAEASAGDEVSYKVTYANNTNITLKNLSFVFFYPDGSAIIKDGALQEDQTDTFVVDSLNAGQSEEKELKAFLVGNRGDIKKAKVNLVFKAGTFKSQFEKTEEVSTTITKTPVALSLVAPPSFVGGQKLTYILDYRNESDNEINNLRFEFSFPDGFTFISADMAPTSGNNVWDIAKVKKDGRGRISIQGILNGREGDAKTITVNLQRKLMDTYIPYEKAFSDTVISSPLLGLAVTANGDTDYIANPGEKITYIIKYKNISTYSLSGLNLTVKLSGDMYDYPSINTQGGFFNDTTKTITWNSGSVPLFGNLQPNALGEIRFFVKLKTAFPENTDSGREFSVRADSQLITINVPSDFPTDEISTSASNITKITSKPTIRQLGYYNDPQFGSSGPLPPQVGKETLFTIHWQLSNPGNALRDTKVVGILPTGISWKNLADTVGAPTLVFDPNTSTVTWAVDHLPQGIGINSEKYEASFQIGATPSSLQMGDKITLIKGVQFSGTDSFTNANLLIKARDLTSDNLIDRPKEGKVQ